MAATVVYNKFSNVIAISGTVSSAPGDLITGKDSAKNAQSQWIIKGFIWSGASKANGDSCVLTDGDITGGSGKNVLDLTCGTAKETAQEFLHEESFIRCQGLYIKTLSHGTLYLYT